jgi:Lon-like protease
MEWYMCTRLKARLDQAPEKRKVVFMLRDRQTRLHSVRSFLLGLAASGLAIVLLALIPMPYIVYEPGTAESTRPMVKTEGEIGKEEGKLLLTTVEVTFANMFKFVEAGFDPNAELFRKEAILGGRSRDDYAARQQMTMRSSQANAVEAAYNALKIPYDVLDTSVLVTNTLEGMGAEGVLLPGDQLIELNGRKIRSADDVAASIEGVSSGQKISLKVKRGDETKEGEIELKPLPQSSPPRPGIGIGYAVLQEVTSVDPAKRVTITAGKIGGPSAGLMFALEIVNQLTAEDITKGHIVAGTGEISTEGIVRPIGGIRHKVVAADREGAEVFFAPKENAADAEAKSRDIGTKMKVVPVSTIQDALNYLALMDPK